MFVTVLLPAVSQLCGERVPVYNQWAQQRLASVRSSLHSMNLTSTGHLNLSLHRVSSQEAENTSVAVRHWHKDGFSVDPDLPPWVCLVSLSVFVCEADPYILMLLVVLNKWDADYKKKLLKIDFEF